MADRGYVLLWRKFWDSDLFKTSQPFSEREAWLYLFSNLANGIERNGVPRGQFEASRNYLARKWGWAESRVYRFLCKLERENMIQKLNRQSDRQSDRFIVCKYEAYQTVRTGNRTGDRTAITKEGLNESKKEKDIPRKSRGTKTAVPKDFIVTEGMKIWAKEKAPWADIDSETPAFIDHAISHDRRLSDWEAGWRNWMRGVKKYQKQSAKQEPLEIKQGEFFDTGRIHGHKPVS